MTTIIESKEMAGLALLPQVTAIQLFESGNVRTILEKIKSEARSIVTDPTTEKGRKEIASLAHKVARSKTAMDEMGKSLTDEQWKFIDRINEERRMIRDELDALKEEVRRPLTEYEEREKARVSGHEARIAEILSRADVLPSDSVTIKAAIDAIKDTDLDGFEEFRAKAETTLYAALHRLGSAYTVAKEDEDRRAREEAERIERERKEREEREARIAAEAAEAARIAAERKAAEQARIAEEKREAERKAEAERLAAIEREKVEAEERHRREIAEAEARVKREAAEAERDRLAKEAQERATAERKAANEKHRAKVRKEALAGIAFNLDTCEDLLAAIEAGKVPHVTLNF